MRGMKVAWITGCSRGLGRAMVEGLAAEGWKVAGCARSEGALQDIREQLGDGHYFAPLDVTDDEAVATFCADAGKATGVPDLLVNNAALMNDPAPLWEIPAKQFAALTDVNINGVANLIRHTVPLMIDRGSGVVVNFSSGWGRSTSPEVAPYCATKWAIEGLTQAMAQELPEGVAAVALNPGVIDTDMLREAWGEGAASYPGPEAWAARAVPFLAQLGPRDNGGSLTVP